MGASQLLGVAAVKTMPSWQGFQASMLHACPFDSGEWHDVEIATDKGQRDLLLSLCSRLFAV